MSDWKRRAKCSPYSFKHHRNPARNSTEANKRAPLSNMGAHATPASLFCSSQVKMSRRDSQQLSEYNWIPLVLGSSKGTWSEKSQRAKKMHCHIFKSFQTYSCGQKFYIYKYKCYHGNDFYDSFGWTFQ